MTIAPVFTVRAFPHKKSLQFLLADVQSSDRAKELQGTNMLYPYRFQPILAERVWGGDALARYGKAVKPGQHIG